jgi:hypothetical protein
MRKCWVGHPLTPYSKTPFQRLIIKKIEGLMPCQLGNIDILWEGRAFIFRFKQSQHARTLNRKERKERKYIHAIRGFEQRRIKFRLYEYRPLNSVATVIVTWQCCLD